MKAQINRVVIELVEADLFSQPVDVVVVPVGPELRLPADVARRAGIEIQRQIATLGRLTRVSAAMIDGGGIEGKKLLLALTSGSSDSSDRSKLASTTYECLHLAESRGLESVAFPPLTTAARDFTLEISATTMLSQIVDYTFEDLEHLRAVTVCLSDAVSFDIFEEELLTQIDDLRRSGEGTISF